MSFSKACCIVTPLSSNYTPKGIKETVADLELYIIGEPNGNNTLIGYYDIFGFHNNTFQFCDKLADLGYYVVMPDFFRGKAWSEKDMQPENIGKLKKWASVDNSWENKIKKDTLTVLDHLKGKNEIHKTGAFGFCWGARPIFDALMEDKSIFQSAAGIHPSALSEKDLKSVVQPVLLILTKQEEALLTFGSQLGAKNLQCRDYTDQQHGFCAARGDFSDTKNRERTTEALKEVAEFFDKHMSPESI